MFGGVSEPDGRARFPRRERTGAFAGRTAAQFVLMLGAFLGALGFSAMDLDMTSFYVPVFGFVFAIAAWQHRREPLINLIAVFTLHFWAQATGQNTYIRDTSEQRMIPVLPHGTRADGGPVPVVRDTFTLPGGLATVRIVDDPVGGCFLIDAKRSTVSIVVAVDSEAWELRDTAGQLSAYDGFVEWFKGLEHLRGLKEVVARVRVDRAPSNAAKEYAESVDAHFPDDHVISTRLQEEYDVVLQAARSRAMAFNNHVTFTFSLAALRPEIRHRGGGLAGIADYLESAVELMRIAAEGARLRWSGRLSGDEFDDLLAASWDPISTVRRKERSAGTTLALRETPPPVMSITRSLDHVRVDGTAHSVYWIAEWPRTEVRPGFLLPILYSGSGSRVLTLQFRPEPVHVSMRRVARALAGIAFARTLRERFGSPTSAEQEREEDEVTQRDEQLADGFVDVGFRGYITVSAEDEQSLARARGELEMSAPSARLTLALMWARQGQAFFTAALPLGIGAQR